MIETKDNVARWAAVLAGVIMCASTIYMANAGAVREDQARRDRAALSEWQALQHNTLSRLVDRVDAIDQCQDEWHAVKIPEGVAVVHSGGEALLAGHTHLDPWVNLYCKGCQPLVEGAAIAFRTALAQQQAREKQRTDVRPEEE